MFTARIAAAAVLSSAALCAAAPAQAAVFTPTGYTFGVAPTNGSYPDSTGTELTDGFANTLIWNQNQPLSDGPEVGWQNVTPQITFSFAAVIQFGDIVFRFQDADGAGAVNEPASVTINGVVSSIAGDPNEGPGGASPFDFVFDGSALSPTDTLSVSIVRSTQWVMLSEVTFVDPSAVPIPAAGVLLLGGLGGLGVLSRRRRG